jgi:predicted transcriptional regulator
MAVNTVNISFQKDLLKKIDKIAREESRSRSELIREAARMYIEKKSAWDDIFALGDSIQENLGLSERDVVREVKNSRKKRMS